MKKVILSSFLTFSLVNYLSGLVVIKEYQGTEYSEQRTVLAVHLDQFVKSVEHKEIYVSTPTLLLKKDPEHYGYIVQDWKSGNVVFVEAHIEGEKTITSLQPLVQNLNPLNIYSASLIVVYDENGFEVTLTNVKDHGPIFHSPCVEILLSSLITGGSALQFAINQVQAYITDFSATLADVINNYNKHKAAYEHELRMKEKVLLDEMIINEDNLEFRALYDEVLKILIKIFETESTKN